MEDPAATDEVIVVLRGVMNERVPMMMLKGARKIKRATNVFGESDLLNVVAREKKREKKIRAPLVAGWTRKMKMIKALRDAAIESHHHVTNTAITIIIAVEGLGAEVMTAVTRIGITIVIIDPVGDVLLDPQIVMARTTGVIITPAVLRITMIAINVAGGMVEIQDIRVASGDLPVPAPTETANTTDPVHNTIPTRTAAATIPTTLLHSHPRHRVGRATTITMVRQSGKNANDESSGEKNKKSSSSSNNNNRSLRSKSKRKSRRRHLEPAATQVKERARRPFCSSEHIKSAHHSQTYSESRHHSPKNTTH